MTTRKTRSPLKRHEDTSPDRWRSTSVYDLGLSDKTARLLLRHRVDTVADLVAAGPEPKWLSVGEWVEVTDALHRFRHRLSNAGIEAFDLARGGIEPPAARPEPKRKRKGRAAS